MKFNYKILINVAVDPDDPYLRPAKHMRFGDIDPYQAGDLLAHTWTGDIDADDSLSAAWKAVQIHNMDSRPDGKIGPGFSAGDVVAVTHGPLTVHYASTGRDLIQVRPPFNISDKTYLDITAEQRTARDAAQAKAAS